MNKSQKCSTSQLGRIVIHKDNVEKRIFEEDLYSYIKLGYEVGRSENHKKHLSESLKGNKSSLGRVVSDETKEKISSSLRGNTPWNKGLTKESDERVKKYSKPHTEESKKLMSDKKKGHTVTDETKKKISDNRKGKYTGYRPPEIGEKISKAKQGHLVSDETREKISKSKKGVKMSEATKHSKLEKEYYTRKKNNSFNTSLPEKQFLEKLKLEYPNKTIICQYKDNVRYPFYCDFYIVEDDLFIELNAHWTHGGKPYDPEDPECKIKLEEWVEKSKQSQFYKVAINTWTVRDVEKLKCANKNKLNYRTIY